MYVLIVSKNSQFRKLCIDSLVTRGHIAVGVSTFAEGERLLQKAQPDVIIMCPTDCHDKDVQKIRSHYQLRSTPIMMITNERPDRQWAANWKVNPITYPVDGRRLIDALAPLLAH